MARLANVSEATVSNVFNGGSKPVSQKTRVQVLEVARILGYRPDLIARSLKTGKTNTIGLTIPIISSPMLSSLTNVVHESALEKGYTVFVVNTYENPKLETDAFDRLIAQSVDGLIACPVSDRGSDALRAFVEHGIPVVCLDRYVTDTVTDIVATDNVNCSEQATRYLIEQGCQRILCISFSRHASSALDRVKGFASALNQYGLPFKESQLLLIEDPTGNTTADRFAAYLDNHGLPDGILCTTQEIGMGVVRAFKQRNINFPARRMVIFDAEWATLMNPPIPMIEQKSREMAETAVQFLMARINGDTSLCRKLLLDARLVIT